MGLIENTKTYKGRDLETIFFRPIFAGENAEQLGIRTLYNMPVPTTIQMWSPCTEILDEYEPGWNGGNSPVRQQKTIELFKVKAESGFSSVDYFHQVFENIVGRADVNLDDLTGTELEQAETEMFRQAIAESVRVTMWIGDVEAARYNRFNGFLTLISKYSSMSSDMNIVDCSDLPVDSDSVVEIFQRAWMAAPPALKALKSEGNLVYFVTTDIYDAFEQYLDKFGADSAYVDVMTGRRELMYHGIKIVDMGISQYLHLHGNKPSTYCILTDRRNLVLAVNTADYPGSEVRMWYNPDEMENRQRAVFMVGCEVLDEQLLVFADYTNA
jgi:hypothetical protein